MSDITRAKAWTDLVDASDAHHVERTKERAQALSEAAKAWASAAREGAPQRATTTGDDGPQIPFGKSKGTPITKADERDLKWVLGALQKSIDDPEKARWRESNEALAEAIRSELETR
jgi:hypothetical protein